MLFSCVNLPITILPPLLRFPTAIVNSSPFISSCIPFRISLSFPQTACSLSHSLVKLLRPSSANYSSFTPFHVVLSFLPFFISLPVPLLLTQMYSYSFPFFLQPSSSFQLAIPFFSYPIIYQALIPCHPFCLPSLDLYLSSSLIFSPAKLQNWQTSSVTHTTPPSFPFSSISIYFALYPTT